MTGDASAKARDPRRVRQRYLGKNRSPKRHRARLGRTSVSRRDRRASRLPPDYDGEPSPTDAPITCRKPECRAAAIRADHVVPRVIAVGQNFLLQLDPIPLMQDANTASLVEGEQSEKSPTARRLFLVPELNEP